MQYTKGRDPLHMKITWSRGGVPLEVRLETARKQEPAWVIHSVAQPFLIKGTGDAVTINPDPALDLLQHVSWASQTLNSTSHK